MKIKYFCYKLLLIKLLKINISLPVIKTSVNISSFCSKTVKFYLIIATKWSEKRTMLLLVVTPLHVYISLNVPDIGRTSGWLNGVWPLITTMGESRIITLITLTFIAEKSYAYVCAHNVPLYILRSNVALVPFAPIYVLCILDWYI